MSTFEGRIEEIPGVSVDNFGNDNVKSSLFFLSHCHTDHMYGLDKLLQTLPNDPVNKFYCSKLTKNFIIELWNLNDSVSSKINTIDENQTIITEYKLNNKIYNLTVTSVPAGHCPGSIMFLFEINKKFILYTGDFRINSQDLSKIKSLHDEKNVPIKFDNIYLDTTFFDDSFDYLPTRQQSFVEILKFIKNWLDKDEKNIINIEISAKFGSEYIYMKLFDELNIKVHVLNDVYKAFSNIINVKNCITNNPYTTRVHACQLKGNKSPLNCRNDIDVSNIMTVIPSVWYWKNKNLKNKFTDFLSKENRYYVCYSTHSSYQELIYFIKYFKPKKVYPCQ
ncbi:protein artemis-like [Aphidius gifuensis]|uniref:protein artemis-like n=1 Tax=Aphidius gifuensis TaxID=684658 RepID=UPI001CDCF61C|nr:protein artemis-like [Aphidius gifuensis]